MNYADRNLLFGILAVQMNFVGRDALIAAMHAWVLEKSKPLSQILVEQQALSLSRQSLLEQLVDEHLTAHDGNAEKSLAAAGGIEPIRYDLQDIADSELHATLDRLVAHHDFTAQETETTITYGVVSTATTGSRFRILRPHAKGGLGQVSVALDAELDREVALKELRVERTDDPDSRSRFLFEAAITGRLEHPGVVPVYGLGRDAQGRPFYAMRFVKGQTLKEAIDHFHETEDGDRSDQRPRNLALRQLLNRFVAVCNVMAYAHSRGVIHRDLKPANILLGPYGETLVVDWGLAKVVGRGEAVARSGATEATLQPGSGSGSSETLPGTALGTPAYMSPEQAEGRLERVGPLSDVYSLGATLYCLLTGQPPIGETGVGTALGRVQRGEFAPPRVVRQHVPLALEAICLKAMAFKPDERFPSAPALTDELEHWLADEPVSVYREPITVRLSRWGRRHRTLVATAVALLVTTTVGLAVGTILLGSANARTERQRQVAQSHYLRAEANFRKAREAVDEYFTKVSQSKLLNVPGLQPLRKELLESAHKYYQDFLRDRGDDPTVRAEAAEAWYRLGIITHDIGSPTDALEQLRKAEAMYEALARDRPDEIGYLYKRAMCLNDIGARHQELGSAAAWLGDIVRATAIREEVVRRAPTVPEYQKELAISYANLGLAHANQGRLDDAIETLQKSRRIYEKLIEDHPENVDYRRRLIFVDIVLSQPQADAGRVDEGLRIAHRAVEDAEALVREHPGELLNADRLVWCLYGLGLIELREAGKPTDALRTYRRLLELTENLIRENPAYKLYRQNRLEALARIGQIQADLGRADEARPALEQARELGRDQLREDPSNVWVRQSLAYASMALGGLRRTAGRNAEAADLFRRSFELFESLAETGSTPVYEQAASHALCAALLARLPAPEDPDRGRRHAEQAVAMLRKSVASGFRNIDVLVSDPDLVAIRSRTDFQALIRDLRQSRAGIAPSDADRPAD